MIITDKSTLNSKVSELLSRILNITLRFQQNNVSTDIPN